MTTKRLYVIGNGFDLHHKIKSSYSDFGEYLKNSNSKLYDTFEMYFSFEGNWSNLEETLAHLDVDQIIDDASNYLVSYASEDWSDAYHHDYQYEIARIVKLLSKELKEEFTNWILGLAIPDARSVTVAPLRLDVNAKYLSFNYTNTLQKLYDIPEHQVLHIHNTASNTHPDLILGHAYDPAKIKPLNHGADLENQDVRVTEANNILDQYFALTYKPTRDILLRHEDFFSSLTEVSEIYIVGHSLSEVDAPYIQKIVNITVCANPKWIVTYHRTDNIPPLKQSLLAAGAKLGAIEFHELAQLPA